MISLSSSLVKIEIVLYLLKGESIVKVIKRRIQSSGNKLDLKYNLYLTQRKSSLQRY